MLAIEKWAKGKPFEIAFFAPKMAIIARDIHLDFQHTKQRRFGTHQFPLPNLPSWFALYRSHKKPLNFLIKIFSASENNSVQHGDALSTQENSRYPQIETSSLSPDQLEIIEAEIEKNILDELFQEIKDEISSQSVIEPSHKTAMLSLVKEDKNLESSFFILVTVPCWLIYRITPTRLYRNARLGNVDALKKLLMLDPLMLHDPAIGKKIQKLRFTHKTSKYENLLQAPLKNPLSKITSLQMKYAIGGLLSTFAQKEKLKLTAPDIHRLFDAVAQDFDKKHIKLKDSNFSDNEGTFARAIYRYRDEWLQVFLPDTKK